MDTKKAQYKIAVIPGDGTGPEVAREGLKVLEAVGNKYGFSIGENNAMTDVVAFHKNAVAFVSRPYDISLINGNGVKSSVGSYKGVPVRVSMWVEGLVLKVQFDILYGITLVNADRAYKITAA